MRIIHASDLHLYHRPALRWWAGKRLAGMVNFSLRRQFLHDPARWPALVDRLVEDRPEVFLCTGDLAQLGQVSELQAVAAEFQRLAEAGTTVLFCPGNHDRYVRNDGAAERLLNELLQEFGGEEVEPGVRIFQTTEVEILLLDQAQPQGWFSARGWLSEAAWKSLERLSARPKRAPLRIIAGHLPLCTASGEAVKPDRALVDDQRLVLLLQALGADVYLCGHIHEPFEAALSGGIQQFCAGSLTKTGTYGELQIENGEITHSRQSVET